ncbi:hypothetical protein ACLB2K_029821 [Fragaria x ananassa]
MVVGKVGRRGSEKIWWSEKLVDEAVMVYEDKVVVGVLIVALSFETLMEDQFPQPLVVLEVLQSQLLVALRDSLIKAKEKDFTNVEVEGDSKLEIDTVNG